MYIPCPVAKACVMRPASSVSEGPAIIVEIVDTIVPTGPETAVDIVVIAADNAAGPAAAAVLNATNAPDDIS